MSENHSTPLTLEELQSRILYRDQLVMVLDKPPGINVHAGPNGGPSLEDYFPDLKFDYKETPKLAHRLDRDTSGCLVLGRNDRALKKMGKLFESGRVKKTYWAITHGRPPEMAGTIDLPLAKVKMQKGWSMKPAKLTEDGAQTAVTDYKVLEKLRDNRAWVELSPRTGRTHQIRVHLKSLGCPIVGDWLYGANPERPAAGEFPTLCLHARSIEFPLHDGHAPVTVFAEMPQHMADLIG